jgi:hypothetical protein
MANGMTESKAVPRDDHRKSYVCTHVFGSARPVLFVSRPEGDWCSLCGANDHPDDPTAFRVVGLDHVVRQDTSLEDVLDLEPNEEAERATVGGSWVRGRV